jgi:hypothetical protein
MRQQRRVSVAQMQPPGRRWRETCADFHTVQP